MRHGPLPLTFEDRTAQTTNTDFDEIKTAWPRDTKIYQMNSRASRHRSTLPIPNEALIHLDFATDESLGTFRSSNPAIREHSYVPVLEEDAFFGPSLSRKFMGSDGREYKWGYRTYVGQEWSCTTMDNLLVAHYDLKPPTVRTFDVSGNNLIIYEAFTHLVPEIIASFLIMRHIAQFNL
ncbi:hypothetical protein BJ912DRAFT_1042074 [Pholiota molesta]|nr:hypothetical protein BJ912DRAFT_1042074 [Pholiota molesta]